MLYMNGADCTADCPSPPPSPLPSGSAVTGASCSASTCRNTKEVTASSAEKFAFQYVTTVVHLDNITVADYQNLSPKARLKLPESIKRKFSIEIFGTYPPPHGKSVDVRISQGFSVTDPVSSGRRLSSQYKLQAVIDTTMPADEAADVTATIASVFATPAAAAAAFLPAIVEGMAAVPADEGGAFAQALAASLSISEGAVTSAPVDFVTRSYTNNEVRRLNKKCKNKKSWCELVTVSGSKSKCQSFCMGGKCTAARKVKKSCKARCKKKCQSFVLSPYFGTR